MGDRKAKFVSLADPKSAAGLSDDNNKMVDSFSLMLSDNSLFSLDLVYSKFDAAVKSTDDAPKTDEAGVAIALHSCRNGMSKGEQKNEIYIMLSNQELNIQPILVALNSGLSKDAIDKGRVRDTSNALKLVTRIYAQRVTAIIMVACKFKKFVTGSQFSNVARKLGISDPKLAVLTLPTIRDLAKVSNNDGKACLYFAGRFGARQVKKNKEKVDHKDIFTSLCNLFAGLHGVSVTTAEIESIWDGSATEQLWVNPDYKSIVSIDKEKMTLEELFSVDGAMMKAKLSQTFIDTMFK